MQSKRAMVSERVSVARNGRLAAAAMASWGTWEELVLGGAVVRHGTAAWDAVSAEVRARTPFPARFTPQECEARYEDFQKRYSGCDSWYEELRKQRVAELKRGLEKSDDSIGSLQSKLESLNAERASVVNKTSQKESLSLSGNADGIDSSSRHLSKDVSSAGSLTAEAGRGWSSRCQLLPSASAQEHNPKADTSKDCLEEKSSIGYFGTLQACCKKKRAKRKRREYAVKEEPMGNNDSSASAFFMVKQELSEACDQRCTQLSEEADKCVHGDANLDLSRIMHSIMKCEDASVFQHRLEDQQKREGQKKMTPQNVDLESISSRIRDGSISSEKELFEELLLLSNNALAFYRKNSLGYKSALTFRDLVNKTLQQSSQCSPQGSGDDNDAVPIQPGKPKRLGAIQPCNKNVSGHKGSKPPTLRSKKASLPDIPAVSSEKKRRVGRPRVGSGKRQQETPTNGRKRTRTR